MKKITLLLLALILAACSAGGGELTRNQSEWQDANITHYRFELSGAYGDGLAESGYLASVAPVRELSVVADLAGVDLTSTAGISSICGQVRTVAGSSVAGVPVTASNVASGRYAAGMSDRGGHYCVGTDGSSGWSVGIPDHLVFACGWLGARLDSAGTGDLSVVPLDAQVTGKVYMAAGLGVQASITDGVRVTLYQSTTPNTVTVSPGMGGTTFSKNALTASST